MPDIFEYEIRTLKKRGTYLKEQSIEEWYNNLSDLLALVNLKTNKILEINIS